MDIQKASGTLFPVGSRQDLFLVEHPSLPGVVFLRDRSGAGGDVKIYTAPNDGGLPGSETLRATVTLVAGGLAMQTLPTEDVYIRLEAVDGETEFSLVSSSSFSYSRHTV